MYLGDSFAWMREQPSESVDALITDPPYSSGGFTRGDRMADVKTKYQQSGTEDYAPGFEGDNRDQRGFLVWCTLWLDEAMRLCRPGAPACLFTDWRQLPTTTDALQAGGFVWRGIAVWTKEGASRPQMGRFRSDSEYVVWGSRGPMPMRTEVGVLPGSWAVPPVHSSERVHITEKPTVVMEGVVKIAPPDGVVLDPFAGSGSTGVAALRTGRRFIGIEKDPHHFATACARLKAEEENTTTAAMKAGQEPLFGKAG